jgi:hypothetical protein
VRYTLVAGTDDQQVFELEGHGIFTHVFVEGITGAADANGDGFITSDEVGSYVTPRVSAEVSAHFHGYAQTPQSSRFGQGEFAFFASAGARKLPSTPPANTSSGGKQPAPKVGASSRGTSGESGAGQETDTSDGAPSGSASLPRNSEGGGASLVTILEGVWKCPGSVFTFTERQTVTHASSSAAAKIPAWVEAPYAIAGASMLQVGGFEAQLELSADQRKLRISGAGDQRQCTREAFRKSVQSAPPSNLALEGVWACPGESYVFTETGKLSHTTTSAHPQIPVWTDQHYSFAGARTLRVGDFNAQLELDDDAKRLRISGAGKLNYCKKDAFRAAPAQRAPTTAELQGLWVCPGSSFLFTETGKVTRSSSVGADPFPKWVEQPYRFISARTLKVGDFEAQLELDDAGTRLRALGAAKIYSCKKRPVE